MSDAQTMIRLRDYQTDGVNALVKSWRDGMQRPAVVMATGLGKTIVFSHLAQKFIDTQTGPLDALKIRPRGGARVLILVHRDELADQALSKLHMAAPGLHLGKVKAADNDVRADIMVGSVQTLARESRARQLLDAQTYAGDIGLVIVDECHHATAPSYRNIMAALGCYDPDSGTVAAGFTATLARGDGAGLGDVWEDAVFVRSTLWGIANGHLTDVRAITVDVEDLHLSSVKRSGGDYTAKSLGDALMDAHIEEVIRQTIVQHATGRRSILVFTPTVAVAQAVADRLNAAPRIPAEVVHGGTPRSDRLLTYKRFASGDTRVLVNCMVLTEGADFPYADCAVIARPTTNEPLFIQMVGRVLRSSPATGKADALVLLLNGQGGSIRTLVDLDPALVVRPQDGESLADTFERQEEIREQQAKDRARTEASRPLRLQLKSRDVDLFGASAAYQWLRTRRGVMFIPLGGNGEILIWPSRDEDGLWDVVWAPPRRVTGWQRLHSGLDLGLAMAWGESEAEERSLINTGKDASWRRKPASRALLGALNRAGVRYDPGIRAGEASDLKAVYEASYRVDRFVRA